MQDLTRLRDAYHAWVVARSQVEEFRRQQREAELTRLRAETSQLEAEIERDEAWDAYLDLAAQVFGFPVAQ